MDITELESVDPASLPLEELRDVRQQMQAEEDAVSYARRVAQARLDLVSNELEHRRHGDSELELSEELRGVLSKQLTGGPARPPRPTEDLSDHAVSIELDELCSANGFGRVAELSVDELRTLAGVLGEFEQRVSARRRRLFDHLDALSAELVRRYRDGEADVDSLLADD